LPLDLPVGLRGGPALGRVSILLATGQAALFLDCHAYLLEVAIISPASDDRHWFHFKM
jgi:hypothetical protein